MLEKTLASEIKYILLLALLLPVSVNAQMYKWRDANGVLHFSQFPPKAEDKAQVEEVENKQSTIPRVKKNGYVYCGHMRGPNPSLDLFNYLLALGKLIQKQEMYAKHGSSSQSADAKCLADWAKQELKKYPDQLKYYKKKYRALLERRQHISLDKQNVCSQESAILIGEDARKWMNCHGPIDRELKELDREIKKLAPLFRS